MSVEPWFTGTAAVVAAIAPPILMGVFRANGVVAFLGAVIAANTISEAVFRLMKPDFIYGPLYGLAIAMNVVMTLIIVGISVAVSAVALEWIAFSKETKK